MPTFKYPASNFACDNCHQQFTNTTLYSEAPNLTELSAYYTYCPNCIMTLTKTKKTMPKTTKKTNLAVVPKTTKTKKLKRIKQSPTVYYKCLATQTASGLQGRKITQHCSDCKHSAPTLLKAQQTEIQKLVSSYKQVGISLSKLLTA